MGPDHHLILPIRSQLACAARRGFALINPTSPDHDKPTITYLAQPLSGERLKYTRFNDGACDAKGRFLAGTLLSPTPDHEFGGSLYRYDPGTGVCEIIDDDDLTVSLLCRYPGPPHCTRRTPMDWGGVQITRRCTLPQNLPYQHLTPLPPGTSQVHLRTRSSPTTTISKAALSPIDAISSKAKHSTYRPTVSAMGYVSTAKAAFGVPGS